jgi:hypothetical protein
MNSSSMPHQNNNMTWNASNLASNFPRFDSSYLSDQQNGNTDNEFLGFGFTSQDFGPFDSGGQMWMWDRGCI